MKEALIRLLECKYGMLTKVEYFGMPSFPRNGTFIFVYDFVCEETK